MRRTVLSTLIYCIGRNPRALKPVLKMLALYVRLVPFSQFVTSRIAEQLTAASQAKSQSMSGRILVETVPARH